MRINKLISVFLLAMLMGFSSQSFAILASMNAEGSVTSYYGIDSLGISVGDTFSSMTIFDTDTVFDSNSSTNLGDYSWNGDEFQTEAVVGGVNFTTNDTTIRIFDDFLVGSSTRDIYRIESWGFSDTEQVLFNIMLTDTSSTVFDSDSFVLEPDISLFTSAMFYIRSWDYENNLNYMISGTLSSLVDPPVCREQEPCDDVVSVPAPNTVFLFGLGLIAVFFASKGYRRQGKFTA